MTTPADRSSIPSGTARLFVAVWPDEAAVETLARHVGAVGISAHHGANRERDDSGPLTHTGPTEGADIRWHSPATWHITLCFLGDVDVGEAIRAIESLRLTDIPPTIARLGPSIERLGKHLVVPVHGVDRLAADIVAVTSHLGTPTALRFVGHLTVGRVLDSQTPEHQTIEQRAVRARSTKHPPEDVQPKDVQPKDHPSSTIPSRDHPSSYHPSSDHPSSETRPTNDETSRQRATIDDPTIDDPTTDDPATDHPTGAHPTGTPHTDARPDDSIDIEFSVHAVALIRSDLDHHGPHYTTVISVPIGR